MLKLVLIRHGESQWNLENRFTGWTDVDLSAAGVKEAHHAAELLTEGGYTFDLCYTSLLKRAIRTAWITLDDMDLMWVPQVRSWELNERHYGALQGLNKAETAQKHSEEQVFVWRRSYDVPPPPLELDDPRYPGFDRRYAGLTAEQLPRTECLKDTVARVVPYYENAIVPELRKGTRIMIAAHGNSLRALVKYLDNVPDADIPGMNIPTGIPLVYEMDDNLRPIRHYYLEDEAKVRAAMEAVANQGKK